MLSYFAVLYSDLHCIHFSFQHLHLSAMASRNPNNGHYSMGENTLPVPMALFRTNRSRLVSSLKESGHTKGVVLLQGGEEQGLCLGDSADVNSVFQQEAFFHWVLQLELILSTY